jgi:hypothetical protein
MSDGIMPGLSSNSNPDFRALLLLLMPPVSRVLRLRLDPPDAELEYLSVATRIHWSDRVTPGVLAVLARLRPNSRLMRADFLSEDID